jgi:hypothetical protein
MSPYETFGLGVLGCSWAVVSIHLFHVWRSKQPIHRRTALKWGLADAAVVICHTAVTAMHLSVAMAAEAATHSI